MKNLLKKLFVVGLAIGVLAPFIEIPTVKADGRSKHIQSYLFLDVNYLSNGIDHDKDSSTLPVTLFDYYGLDNGSYDGAVNTTIFPFNFPVENNVEIYNVKFNNLKSSADIKAYVALHNKIISWTDDDDDYSYNKNMIYYGDEITGNTFTSKPKSEYSSTTILLHGAWTNYNSNFEPIVNSWTTIDNKEEFYNSVIQNELSSYVDGTIQNATVTTTGSESELGNINPGDNEMTVDYLDEIVTGNLDTLVSTGDLEWMNNQYYLPITITRKLKDGYENALENKKLGYMDESGKLFVFGENGDSKSGDCSGSQCTAANVAEVKKSYEYFVDFIEAGSTNEKNYMVEITTLESGCTSTSFKTNTSSCEIDFDTHRSYYWPFILTVEYETNTTPSEEEGYWTLEYDGNDEKALNTPEDVEDILFGEKVEVADGPELEGYKFVEWCTDKAGKGDCYKVGDFIYNEDNDDIVTLYAQWGKGGTDEPGGDTGVFSYILSFMAVGAIAGTIYVISKKKNLFKQI